MVFVKGHVDRLKLDKWTTFLFWFKFGHDVKFFELLFLFFHMRFWKEMGNISFPPYFCCVSLFFASLCVLGVLILCGKIRKGYVKKKTNKN